MNETSDFYTLKGYQIIEKLELTPSMEDYLEMICRILKDNPHVRVGVLSKMLHVKPSSVTKMIQHLNHTGYICAEKYGYIYLTEKGKKTGQYLLYRHDVIHHFLCVLNDSKNELEQAEKIEHFLDPTTIQNLDTLTKFLTSQEWKLTTKKTDRTADDV